MRRKIFVRPAEMTISEKSPMSRERRRMGRLQDKMTRTVDKLSFTLSIRAPQNKNKIFTLLCQTMYNRIGKLLPALVLMRTGLMRL